MGIARGEGTGRPQPGRFEITSSAGPSSMNRTMYMTAIRSAITQAIERSWVTNRYDS